MAEEGRVKIKDKIFKSLVVEETKTGEFVLNVKKKAVKDLPEGDVLVRVGFSSLNYKDALSASGNRGVTRKFPHTPGIDAAGAVADSDSKDFKVGDKVIITGYDLGMNTSGGFEQWGVVSGGRNADVPEPATMAILAIGGMGLLVRRRRRK